MGDNKVICWHNILKHIEYIWLHLVIKGNRLPQYKTHIANQGHHYVGYCSVFFFMENSSGQATERKQGLLRKPRTLSHTQMPPAFSFFLYVAEPPQPMHVTLCPQQKPRLHRPYKIHIWKGRDCACVNSWLSRPAPGACQPYSPFNNITQLDYYNRIYVCLLSGSSTHLQR